MLRRALGAVDVPLSVKKGVVRSPYALRKGVDVDGIAGLATPPIKRILQHAGLAAWLLDQEFASLIEVQATTGRWVSNFMLRRQCLSCLDEAWRWITKHEFMRQKSKLGAAVREELLMCMMSVPLIASDMRRPLDGRPIATDASERGGGVSVGVALTEEGVQAAVQHAAVPAALHERGVIVVEFFGGSHRLWGKLNMTKIRHKGTTIDTLNVEKKLLSNKDIDDCYVVGLGDVKVGVCEPNLQTG